MTLYRNKTKYDTMWS